MTGQMRSLSQQVVPAVVQVLVSGYGLIDSESVSPDEAARIIAAATSFSE